MFDSLFDPWSAPAKGCGCLRVVSSGPGPSMGFYSVQLVASDGSCWSYANYGDFLTGREIRALGTDGCLRPIDRSDR